MNEVSAVIVLKYTAKHSPSWTFNLDERTMAETSALSTSSVFTLFASAICAAETERVFVAPRNIERLNKLHSNRP
jgi:hypothetical protein